MLLNMSTLIDLQKIIFLIGNTDSSCHMAIVCKSIFQLVTNHHISVKIFVILVFCQKIICHFKCMTSIVVVCIDNRKRTVNLVNTAQDRMTGSPGFYSSLRNLIAFRKIMKILEHISNLYLFTETVADSFAEVLFIFFFNDKYYFFKSCFYSIINGKVHNDMTFSVNGVDLFQTTVAASHSSCHNY